MFGRRLAGDLLLQGRDGVLERRGVLQASAAWPVKLWSVCSLSHLARSAGLAASSLQVDRGRGTVRLVGLMAIERPCGHLEVEAHHRLVDAADLLHVERAVAQPLAVEDEQVLEHAEDDAVGDARRLECRSPRLSPSIALGPAFEERITVGIEQIALARRQIANRPWLPPSWTRRNSVSSWAQLRSADPSCRDGARRRPGAARTGQ